MTTTNTSIISELPQGLRILAGVKCWAGQQYARIGDKISKTPKGINGITTGPNRPQDLGTYEEAAAMCRKYNFRGMALHAGIGVKAGYVLQEADLDKVRNPETGEITPKAAEVVQFMNTYTEISISGTGLHLFYLAKPDSNIKQNVEDKSDPLGAGTRLEMFAGSHFCGVTGNVYGEYSTIAMRDLESKSLYLQYFEYAEIDQAIAETEKKRTSATPGNRDQVERLKGNLEDYLQRKGINTRKRLFRCLNPEHNDDIKSMTYYRKKNICHCFGCRANYDIFDLAGIDAGLTTFPEKIKYIADLYGETVEPYQPAKEPEQDPDPLEGTNIAEYLSGQYAADLEKFKQGGDIKTGFPDLDQNFGGGLYAGLYVIGASSSTGKTTFTLQLADQIAETQRPVLFFSLEQSRLELVTKSISRTARKMYPGNQTNLKTSLQIRKGYTSEETEQALKQYARTTAPFINIIEGNFKTTADTIRATVEKYINQNNARPVVIVDYLQIVKPGETGNKKEMRLQVDDVMTAFKRLSRDLDTPVIIISSVNRSSYYRPLSMDSFKESGGVEFTADVLLGLELAAVYTFKKETDTEREEILDAEKKKPCIPMVLKGIKNRYGIPKFRIDLNYIPNYDYFTETGSKFTVTRQTINDIPTL